MKKRGNKKTEQPGNGAGKKPESPMAGAVATATNSLSGRKLKTSINIKNLVKTGQKDLEIDLNAYNPSKILCGKTYENVTDKPSPKNMLVESADNDKVELLMFSDFEALADSMEPITGDGGIKKKVQKPGRKGTVPPPNSKVWIKYTAYIEDMEEPFAKTPENKPKAFRIGRGEVIPVLDIAVTTMELKEISKFLATPDYAYGKLGLMEDVAPAIRDFLRESPILFTIELYDIMEIAPVSAMLKLGPEERAEMLFNDIAKTANDMKAEGNEHCKEKDWQRAIAKYRRGIHVLERFKTDQESVDTKRNELLLILYNNLAQCHLNTNEYEKVLDDCALAINLNVGSDTNLCKAYFRYAKGLYHLGRFPESRSFSKKALDLKPGDSDVRVFFEEVSQRIEKDQETEKELMKKMMGGLKLK